MPLEWLVTCSLVVVVVVVVVVVLLLVVRSPGQYCSLKATGNHGHDRKSSRLIVR